MIPSVIITVVTHLGRSLISNLRRCGSVALVTGPVVATPSTRSELIPYRSFFLVFSLFMTIFSNLFPRPDVRPSTSPGWRIERRVRFFARALIRALALVLALPVRPQPYPLTPSSLYPPILLLRSHSPSSPPSPLLIPLLLFIFAQATSLPLAPLTSNPSLTVTSVERSLNLSFIGARPRGLPPRGSPSSGPREPTTRPTDLLWLLTT